MPSSSPLQRGYQTRRSTRAKRVRVTVAPDGAVEVVLPRWAGPRDAETAVRELGPWIERRRAALRRAHAEQARPPGTVPYLGELLTLLAEPGRTRVHRRGDELLVPVAPRAGRDAAAVAHDAAVAGRGARAGAVAPGAAAEASTRGAAAGGVGAQPPLEPIERWYRRQARAEVATRLDAACAQVGARYSGLTIRGQRTRWASCSANGAMSFNWRLLLAPPEVLDYVVWHEICHLDVRDHSPRFWALLARRCPDYERHAGWLRRYGATLTLER